MFDAFYSKKQKLSTHRALERILRVPQSININLRSLIDSKFFRELKFQPLPSHNLPRLPVRTAHFQGQPYYCVPGPCVLVQIQRHFLGIFLVRFWYYLNLFYGICWVRLSHFIEQVLFFDKWILYDIMWYHLHTHTQTHIVKQIWRSTCEEKMKHHDLHRSKEFEWQCVFSVISQNILDLVASKVMPVRTLAAKPRVRWEQCI